MDDDDVIRTFAERVGRRFGWDLEVSRRGEEMLAQWTAADPKPDLVILDVLVRPGLGGIETLSRLRELGADVPVLMASAFAPDLDDPTLERLGPARRISKPFGIQTLRDVVEDFLVEVQRA